MIRDSMHTKFVSGWEVSSFCGGRRLTESQLALLRVFLKRNNTLWNNEKLGLIYDADSQTAELAPEKEIAQRKRQLEKKSEKSKYFRQKIDFLPEICYTITVCAYENL